MGVVGSVGEENTGSRAETRQGSGYGAPYQVSYIPNTRQNYTDDKQVYSSASSLTISEKFFVSATVAIDDTGEKGEGGTKGGGPN